MAQSRSMIGWDELGQCSVGLVPACRSNGVSALNLSFGLQTCHHAMIPLTARRQTQVLHHRPGCVSGHPDPESPL